MSKARIAIESRADFLTLKTLRLDEVYRGEKFIDVLVDAEELQLLQNSGLNFTVSVQDMTAFYQSRFDPGRNMGGYRTLSEIELVMDSIATANPTTVQAKWSIGNSLQGRPIYVMKISDNPLLDESEPEVYYYAAHHAREVITPEILIYYMRYLTNNYGANAQVTYLVNNRELFFSPCMNPDGYHYNEETDPGGGGLWRKNRRNNGDGSFGIDLNRNYGYQWGFDNQGSSANGDDETFRGASGFSEPETQVEKAFVESRNFVITLSYHSYADLFLYPWGYAEIFTPDNEIFEAMGDTIGAMAGYSVGPPWQVLYPVNGSSDDWGYGEQTTKNKNFAVTIEVGNQSDDFWPPTSRITPLVTNAMGPAMFLARIADAPHKLKAPATPQIYSQPDIAVSEFDLYWHHFDLDNPAQAFEVWQLAGYSQIVDDLESATENWITDGFTLSTTQSSSATHSFFSGNVSNSNTRFTAATDLHVDAGDSLKFAAWYEIEDGWDYGFVEVSTNAGLSWATIPGNITTATNPHGNNPGHGITGSSSGWVQGKFSLEAYTNQDILVRFRYYSDGFVNNGGLYIDDIYPTDMYASKILLSNSETDSTFHVAGLTDGAYYFRVRARDAEDQFSMYSGLEQVNVALTPSCTWLVGEADGNGIYTISDAVYVIAYVFSAGSAPAPDPIGSGDSDCNGIVTISDAVFLINYIFSGGASPGATCNCTDYAK